MLELNFFGKEAKFHHIGIAVRSIKDTSPTSDIVTDPIQKVRVAFLSLNGINLELIEPYGDNSPVTESLKKGIKFLHVCYTVPDIEKSIRECRRHGFHCIRPAVEASAFNNKIAWVYSKEFGLFELLQYKKVRRNG